MEALHTIQRLAYSEGADDGMGNTTDVFADPVSVDVYAIYNATDETVTNAREASTVDVTVLLPSGSGFTRLDRAVVSGDTYEVVGDLETFTLGPFGYAPGDRLNLRKVDG